MRKTDKKLDNQIRKILTDICETRLKDVIGFQWITHVVNYSDFPESLKIICVFDTKDNIHGFMATAGPCELSTLLQEKLCNINNIAKHISYTTE